MADDLLIQKVIDGKVENTATKTTGEEKETRGTSNLGKDAFLQLLVAEMQNQDPLEPSTNTEWISQLATFSQLEELQSLSSTAENSQIFSLVGKQVIVTTESASGGKITKSGVVDFITYNGGEAKFSIDGSLYGMDNLSQVLGNDYHYDKNKPSLVKQGQNYSFNGDEPQDIQFEVNLGNDVAKAENVALTIGNTVLPSEYITLTGKTVTIKAELLQEIAAGTYPVDLVFDDRNFTTVKGAFNINIYNPHPANAEAEEGNKTADAKENVPDAKASETQDTDKAEDTSKDTSAAEKGSSNNSADSDGYVMQPGELKNFDYDAVRALYPELTDEEFAHEYGYLFFDDEEGGN
jgi:flagellar basal-body rod modification protein FlgD